MRDFKPGNLLIAATLKTTLLKIYQNSSDNKLKTAIAYLNGGQYSKSNVGIASLQESSITNREDFVAFNNVNNDSDLNKSDACVLKDNDLTLCLKDEKSLPVKRLAVNNLEVYVPTNLGYANSKTHCTERKILSKILVMMKEKGVQKGSLKGTLYLYTKLEPCVYCMTALNEFIEHTGTKVFLLYEELIFEIERDNLSYGPRFITNVIDHTNYPKLKKYDKELALSVKEAYEKRGKYFD